MPDAEVAEECHKGGGSPGEQEPDQRDQSGQKEARMVDKISQLQEGYKTSSREEYVVSKQEVEEKTSTKVAWDETSYGEEDRVSQEVDKSSQQGNGAKITYRKDADQEGQYGQQEARVVDNKISQHKEKDSSRVADRFSRQGD